MDKEMKDLLLAEAKKRYKKFKPPLKRSYTEEHIYGIDIYMLWIDTPDGSTHMISFPHSSTLRELLQSSDSEKPSPCPPSQ